MIKLYDLIFEVKGRLKNYADLGDKNEEFEAKLATMGDAENNLLIKQVVGRLKGSQLEEFKNLLNKYSDVKDLEAPKTPLEKSIANLAPNPTGPGEILFHLELQDSSMETKGITQHDLIVKGKVWEVKKVTGLKPEKTSVPNKPQTTFSLAGKGKISQFKFNMDLLKTVIILDKIIENSKLEDEFNDISPNLRTALDQYEAKIHKNSPRESILKGDHGIGFRKKMIEIINTIKSEIEVNTDDEYTNVRFGGVGIIPKEKGIDPVSIQSIDGDSVTLNFIGRDTLKAIEILNDLPYVQDADFENDLDAAAIEGMKDMPSMIIWGLDGRIIIIEKDKFEEVFEFGGISRGDLQVRVKQEVWRNL